MVAVLLQERGERRGIVGMEEDVVPRASPDGGLWLILFGGRRTAWPVQRDGMVSWHRAGGACDSNVYCKGGFDKSTYLATGASGTAGLRDQPVPWQTRPG